LLPYHATTQGGRGVVRASDSAGAGGAHDPATYTANFNRAQSGLVRVVNELLWRGVSYEQLGALPVSGDWAMESLDAGGTPLEMLNRSPRATAFKREGMGLARRFLSGIVGSAPAPEGGWSMPTAYTYDPADLLRVALGASMQGPDRATHASELMRTKADHSGEGNAVPVVPLLPYFQSELPRSCVLEKPKAAPAAR
jgi:hypothetical protein